MPSSVLRPPSPPLSPSFPYTTLFRSHFDDAFHGPINGHGEAAGGLAAADGGRGGCQPDQLAFEVDQGAAAAAHVQAGVDLHQRAILVDRKSTRLKSSHLGISYAVFCSTSTLPTALSLLSLHDALPISLRRCVSWPHQRAWRSRRRSRCR